MLPRVGAKLIQNAEVRCYRLSGRYSGQERTLNCAKGELTPRDPDLLQGDQLFR